jgi:uncharacterized Zn finger protein (UPF0148 family)
MLDGAELTAVKDKIRAEIAVGGELKDLPCPYCGLPRCQRSDYIRCSKCGLNWDMGLEAADYERHPAMAGKPRTRLGG